MLPPLVVDLDGTLIYTDMLHESAIKVLRDQPLTTLWIPVWLSRGKAVLKEHLAQRSDFDPQTLPYNEALLDWLRQQKMAGRTLVLCTASDRLIADAIATHLGLFDEVIASDGRVNLTGRNKADALAERFGATGFDYAGNSWKDIPVWARARRAVVVNAPASVARAARDCCDIEQIFLSPRTSIRTWIHVVRAHQWLKNLLIFVPLLAAHDANTSASWFMLMVAFFAFSFCASSVYILNDLLDLESDRLHVRKRRRPFASGLVPAWAGVVLMPMLLISGITLATWVGGGFLNWLLFYFVLTCAYSFILKRVMLIDCITLAMLYTLRIVAGAAAAGVALSFWLITESAFLFLSLAFVKRYAELSLQSRQEDGEGRVHGRGYHTNDATLIRALGIGAGYVAVLVLALYLNSPDASEIYPHLRFVWMTLPVIFFWISWMWLQASRGNMHDDPLVFAAKDRISLLAGACFVGFLLLGSTGLPIGN
ncbi:MAG: UbiA family prenyltransferase [Gammaproteobacteria bacterium]|nr:UbiA family prenyltransferase [Gammaproteobacteria bacterium]